jgi:hypothetical protein
MIKAGFAVPLWISGTFLVDTGASGTCIDPTLIQPLGIPPSGRVHIQTPSTGSTSHECSQYDVSIYIPGADNSQEGLLIPALPILETPLMTQGIVGLIGRDILDRCTLIYNSGLKMFTLAY